MRFGVCASYQQAAALHDITFDFLEENVQRFLVPEAPLEEFEDHLRRARALPIPIEAANVLLPADLTLVDAPARHVDNARLERYLRTTLQRAEQAGISVIVFGSGAARACPPEVERAAAVRQIEAHLAIWGGWASAHGVQIVLEPIRFEETNVLNTVAEAAASIARVAIPGAQLLVDTYHMACNDESPGEIERWVSWIAHVHVAEQRERAAPGRHGEDFRPYFGALRRGGYDGRISIECRWGDFANEVGPAIAALREQWAQS